MSTTVPTDVFAELTWRGLIHQTTDEAGLPAWLAAKSRSLYAGFDPTADSLHVGHLVALMTLRRFQKAGHRPIALVGGATGLIGDPSGRSKERNLLSVDELQHNVDSIRTQLGALLDFESGDGAAILANNYDWLKGFGYLEFLRDVGKNFPVNVMLAKDSVKARLERTDSGLSYTEFSYMLLQAYDFVHLHRAHGCELQIGGSDQWGNITAGIDLARRMGEPQLYGITSPLLTDSDGKKMGKTADGQTVWLSPERTSPYGMYQFWLNLNDSEVGKCLRYFTELSREEIEALDEAVQSNPGKREAQRRLGEEVTQLIHGEVGLNKALTATKTLFGAEIEDLSDADVLEIFADVPNKELPRDMLAGDGLNIVDAFVEAGLAKSKGEARRLIKQGGGYLNNRRVDSADLQLSAEHLASETVMVLRSGKKKKNTSLLRFS
ncbi:MAG: tyrosine--tRNA ligase [Planctomycetales bacterium]